MTNYTEPRYQIYCRENGNSHWQLALVWILDAEEAKALLAVYRIVLGKRFKFRLFATHKHGWERW